MRILLAVLLAGAVGFLSGRITKRSQIIFHAGAPPAPKLNDANAHAAIEIDTQYPAVAVYGWTVRCIKFDLSHKIVEGIQNCPVASRGQMFTVK